MFALTHNVSATFPSMLTLVSSILQQNLPEFSLPAVSVFARQPPRVPPLVRHRVQDGCVTGFASLKPAWDVFKGLSIFNRFESHGQPILKFYCVKMIQSLISGIKKPSSELF